MAKTKLTPWHVRDLPQSTRNKIKAYAGLHGLTIPQALDHLADLGLKQPK